MKLGLLVINLDRSPGRLATMATRLDAIGLAWERLPATDARQLDAEPLARAYSPALNRRQFHKDLSPGEVACFTSHRRAWQRLLAAGWDGAVVLEDDVLLAPEFPAVIAALAAAPGRWDAVKLATFGRRPALRRTPLTAPGGAGAAPCWLVEYRKIPALTCAQAFSARAAAQLFAATQEFGRPADVALQWWWETGVRFHGVEPYPAAPEPDAPSDIHGGGRRLKPPRRRLARMRQSLVYQVLTWRHSLRPPGPPTASSG